MRSVKIAIAKKNYERLVEARDNFILTAGPGWPNRPTSSLVWRKIHEREAWALNDINNTDEASRKFLLEMDSCVAEFLQKADALLVQEIARTKAIYDELEKD